MVEIPENERVIFALEVGVIILSIVAAVVFIYFRGNPIFYVLAAVVLIIAFYAIFLMSKLEEAAGKTVKKQRKR